TVSEPVSSASCVPTGGVVPELAATADVVLPSSDREMAPAASSADRRAKRVLRTTLLLTQLTELLISTALRSSYELRVNAAVYARLVQAWNTYARPTNLAFHPSTTAVLPETATEKPRSVKPPEPFNSATCFHPLAVRVNTYAGSEDLTEPGAPTIRVVPDRATERPKQFLPWS